MSAIPFADPRGQRRIGTAVVNLLDSQGVPDWCNRCGRTFTLNNHGWLRPLTPQGEPDKLGRLMYESICQSCGMPSITLRGVADA